MDLFRTMTLVAVVTCAGLLIANFTMIIDFHMPASDRPIYHYDPLCNTTQFNDYLLARIKCPNGKLNFTDGCQSHVPDSGSPIFFLAVFDLCVLMFSIVVAICIFVPERMRDIFRKGEINGLIVGVTVFLILGSIPCMTGYTSGPMEWCPALPSSLYGRVDDRHLHRSSLTIEQYEKGCYFYPSPSGTG